MPTNPTEEEALAWPAPNYVDPETRTSLVLGVEIPLIILVITFTSTRFYSRTFVLKSVGADDWFMLAASIIAIATYAMACVSTFSPFQTGYHLWDLRPEFRVNPVPALQMGLAIQLSFIVMTCLMKLSVLLTYLRIFPSQSNRYFCYTMISITAVWGVSSFFTSLLQCNPVQSFWMLAAYPNRVCINLGLLYYGAGSFNVVTDFIIFLWPAKDLSKIHISLRQRVNLIAMFSVGVLICIAGLCRIWASYIYLNTYDGLWNGATLYVVISIESSFGICCGSLPACKPLMSKAFPRVFNPNSSEVDGSPPRRCMRKARLPGQNFSIGTMDDAILKEESYTVEYEKGPSHFHSAKKDDDLDDGFDSDEEFIRQEKRHRSAVSSRISPV